MGKEIDWSASPLDLYIVKENKDVGVLRFL